MHKNIFFCLFFLPLLLPAQKTWYVAAQAPAGGSGTSWAGAFNDLQQALPLAQKGDAIWVAKGEYRPDPGKNRARAFELKSGVRLYGGFAGVETEAAQRQWQDNPTVLSGNIGNLADSTDNAYTILLLNYPDSSTLIDGFTFRHGYAVSDTASNNFWATRSGAAVYVQAINGVALPTFSHCTFRDNVAAGSGGAVFVRGQNTLGSTPVFRDCLFFNNLCGRSGGAVSLTGGAAYDRGIEFERCQFVRNRSLNRTGGVHVEKTFGVDVLDFVDCVASGNEGDIFAGFLYYTMQSAGAPLSGVRFDRCDFSENKVGLTSSWSHVIDIYTNDLVNPDLRSIFVLKNSIIHDQLQSQGTVCSVGFATSQTKDSIFVSGNTFKQNLAPFNFLSFRLGYSSLPMFIGGLITIDRNRFFQNKGDGRLILSDRQTKLENNIFEGNTAMPIVFGNGYTPMFPIRHNIFINNAISAVRPYYTAVYDQGFSKKDSAIFLGNLFVNNTVWNRYDTEFYPGHQSATTIFAANNVFFNNINKANGQITLPFGIGFDSVFLRHNLMDVNCAALHERTICGPGNVFSAVPLFVDTVKGDYRLLPCSPGVNAGLNDAFGQADLSVDYLGAPRIQEGRVDMGPFESAPLTLEQAHAIVAACEGQATGRARFDLLQGCAPFRLQWNGGQSDSGEATGLAAGSYRFTLTDHNGRQVEIPISVPVSDPKIALSGDTLTCPGFDDGVLNATVTGGQGDVGYLWNNGVSTATLANLGPGLYVLTATDAVGCRDTARATIVDAPALYLKVDIAHATAPTYSNGRITVSVIAGIGPYQYFWSNGATTAVVEGLPPGQYQITVIDGAGCGYGYAYEVKMSVAAGDASERLATSVAPNPATSSLSLFFGPFEVWQLFSLDGREVLKVAHTTENARSRVHLEGLPSGIYWYRYTDVEGMRQKTGVLAIE